MLTPVAYSDDNVTLVVSGDPWCPFNCRVEQDHQRGYVIDLLQRIANANHYILDYRITPWPRTLLQLSDGSIDIAIGVSSADTQQYVTTKLSWGQVHQATATLSTLKFDWQNLTGLNGKRVLLVKDYDYGTALNNWAKKESKSVEYIYGETTNEQALSRLLRQRADVFINSMEALNWFLLNHGDRIQGNSEQFVIKANGYANDFHLAISRHRPQAQKLQMILDSELARLRDSGELKTILQNYNLRDWAKSH